jgi:alpha-1,6-mannosyltransferase
MSTCTALPGGRSKQSTEMVSPHSSRSDSLLNWRNGLLILIGCGALALYRISLRAHVGNDILWFLKIALIQAVLYVLAAWLVIRGSASKSTLLVVIVFAVLFRLSLLFSPPYLSDDIYRYVWDGRVQAAGINPYRYVPADPALAGLRDDAIYPKMNRRETAHTIYPPITEVIFLLTTRLSESVTWMKFTIVLFEAVACWAIIVLLGLLGLPRHRVLLYAWHPLTVWEFAGSGHADSIAIAFIALALLAHRRRKKIGTGLALAGATLSKTFPFVLFPALYDRWNWKMPLAFVATLVVGYLPYLGAGPAHLFGFLLGFPAERGIESGEEFFLLSAVRRLPMGAHIPTAAFVAFAFLIGVGLMIWVLRRQSNDDHNYINHALVLSSVFVVLVAPHYSWYFAWIIPLLCFVADPAVIYMTLASYLLYLTWLGDATVRVLKIKAGIFVPALVVLLITWFLRRRLQSDRRDAARGST